jgi:hypothetical protein
VAVIKSLQPRMDEDLATWWQRGHNGYWAKSRGKGSTLGGPLGRNAMPGF